MGPTFEVHADFRATLNVSAEATLSATYHVPKVEFVYPPKYGTSVGAAENPKSRKSIRRVVISNQITNDSYQ